MSGGAEVLGFPRLAAVRRVEERAVVADDPRFRDVSTCDPVELLGRAEVIAFTELSALVDVDHQAFRADEPAATSAAASFFAPRRTHCCERHAQDRYLRHESSS